MQLLCSSSLEYGFNEGLDIIPGKILPLKKHNIGWAKIKGVSLDVNKLDIENEYFYFNHGFYFEGQKKYISSKIHDSSCPSIIKYKNNIGLQFHPEKSQLVGKKFLTNLLHGYFDD